MADKIYLNDDDLAEANLAAGLIQNNLLNIRDASLAGATGFNQALYDTVNGLIGTNFQIPTYYKGIQEKFPRMANLGDSVGQNLPGLIGALAGGPIPGAILSGLGSYFNDFGKTSRINPEMKKSDKIKSATVRGLVDTPFGLIPVNKSAKGIAKDNALGILVNDWQDKIEGLMR